MGMYERTAREQLEAALPVWAQLPAREWTAQRPLATHAEVLCNVSVRKSAAWTGSKGWTAVDYTVLADKTGQPAHEAYQLKRSVAIGPLDRGHIEFLDWLRYSHRCTPAARDNLDLALDEMADAIGDEIDAAYTAYEDGIVSMTDELLDQMAADYGQAS